MIAKIDQKQGPGQGENKTGAPFATIDAPGGGVTRGDWTLRGQPLGGPLGVHFSTVVFDTSPKRSRNGARSGQKGHQNGTIDMGNKALVAAKATCSFLKYCRTKHVFYGSINRCVSFLGH